jgi:hypothetical protein
LQLQQALFNATYFQHVLVTSGCIKITSNHISVNVFISAPKIEPGTAAAMPTPAIDFKKWHTERLFAMFNAFLYPIT